MTFQPDLNQQPELPPCQRGNMIFQQHTWKMGRCTQCGLEQPKTPGVKIHKKP